MSEFFKMSVKYTSMAILPIAILLMTYSWEIVQIVYGNGYELASYFLSLYVVVYFLVGIGFNVLGSFFNGLGETRMTLKVTLVNSVVMVVLAPLLTWLLAGNGMIMALILSQLAGTLYAFFTAKKLFRVEIDMNTTAKIYLISLASALPLLAIKGFPLYSNIINVVVGTITYFAIYLLMIPAMKIISPTELKEIRNVLEKIKPLKYLTKPILYCEEKIMLKTP